MTEEKMRKCEELFKELSYLKNQKQKWEKGEKFFTSGGLYYRKPG